MAGKIQIDPEHPIGSLTSGDQQFTIVADTNHSKNSIRAAVNADLDTAAANGVKKVMIEFDLPPLKELERRYPELAGAKTWDEREKILESYKAKQDAVIDAETNKETKGLDMFADADKKKWEEGFSRGYDRAETMIGKRNIDQLKESINAIETHKFFEQAYADPPVLTEDEIRMHAKYFVSAHVKPEDRPEAGQLFDDLMINTRDRGMKLVFSGDRDYEADARLEDAELKLQRYRDKNPAMRDLADAREKDPSFRIPEKDVVAFDKYRREELGMIKDVTAAMKAQNATRTDETAEQRRIDRILELAGDDKTLMIWGAGHSAKQNDFNEMLDRRLQERAAAAGKPAPAPTRVIEVYDDKAAFEQKKQKDGLGPDEPDARYFVKDKETEITPSGQDGLKLKGKPVATAPTAVEQQYAELMGNNVVGSVKSVPDAPAEPTPLRPAPAAPTVTV